MQFKTKQKQVIPLGTFAYSVLLISFTLIAPRLTLYSFAPINETPLNIAEVKKVEIKLPVRLRIPQINVDAPIEYVGLTADGVMDSPIVPDVTGWYNLGPKPGEIGSAVIDGHFGWKNGIPAVFDNLHKLSKGDKIYVEDDNGVTITFVVRNIRSYDSKADASDVFGSSDGKAHLNIVTCEGPWNINLKSRPSRIVVFTDKE